MENRTQKFCKIALLFSHRFDHGAALKIQRKMPHLNITIDRYASIGFVMHYILVISFPYVKTKALSKTVFVDYKV